MQAKGLFLNYKKNRRLMPVSYTHLDVYKRQESYSQWLFGGGSACSRYRRS